jgi:hypothetical protein
MTSDANGGVIGALVAFVASLLVILNVLIPKGGFAAGDVPITWANLGILAGAVVLVLARPGALREFVRWMNQSRCLLPYVFFAIWFIVLSVRDFQVFTNVFMFLGGLLLYPLTSSLTAYSIPSERLATICRVYTGCVILLVLVSFFLYFDPSAQVPGITVNFRDVDTLYTEKNNGARGLLNLFKMVGTYQNGNILGANLLIHLAAVMHFRERRLVGRSISTVALGLLWLALPFTLSRTVIFSALLLLALLLIRNFRPTFIKVALIASTVAALAVGAGYAMERFGLVDMFLHFDVTLNGRLTPEVLQSLADHWLFGAYGRLDIIDVVYVGFATSGGLAMAFALALQWVMAHRYLTSRGMRVVDTMPMFVLVFGFVVVFFDSTYFYPPTAFNFWVAYFIAVRTSAGARVALASTGSGAPEAPAVPLAAPMNAAG